MKISLAYAELRLIVCKFLWNFDLKLLPECDNWIKQNTYMLWEKKALNVCLVPIRQEQAQT